MGGTGNCSVINCTNYTKKISKWKKEICEKHGETHENCACVQPYYLYCFPSIKRNLEHRKKWIEALRRVNADKSTWEPADSSRDITPQRNSVRHPPRPLKRKKLLQDEASNTAISNVNEPPVDHAGYSLFTTKQTSLPCLQR